MKTGKQSAYGTKRVSHLLFGVILAVLLLGCPCLLSFAAAGTASPDPARTGSICVTLYSDFLNGTAVTDGSLTLYHVADLQLGEGNGTYVYTEAFAGCEESPDGTDPGLAETLAEYAAGHGIPGTAAEVGEDGSVLFPVLSPGLYLIVQTRPSEGYYAAEPFLVMLPLFGENGWEYDVDASPKMEELKKIPEETETSELLEKYEEVEEDEEFEDETSSASGSVTGTPGGGGRSDSASGTLPQTGQLNWPIPLLTAVGLFLIILGFALRRENPFVDCHYSGIN